MTGQEIDYETLAQDALRGVVRTVLARVAKDGRLPGSHHFYISFDTRAEGVGLSKRLKEQYPEEMTIVLQYRYWDLHVHDDRFEVKLTFNSIPERLIVPFKAVKVFFDPSVPCSLQFDRPSDLSLEATRQMPPMPESRQELGDQAAPPPRKVVKPRPVGDAAGLARARSEARTKGDGAKSETAKPEPPKPEAVKADPVPAETAGKPVAPQPTAQVVKLDAFRKK